ncbi:MAG: hypothetical protein IPF87_16835 [Gemmatimonadetes bacterium]|nr:hypothetical protein [Gemmatimonadota bacterium]
MRETGALPPHGIRVDFVGECEVYAGTSVRELLRPLAHEHLGQWRGRMPHAESLALQRNADVLLLLARRQPMQVPNNFYEYLGVGRPILAYVDAKGESADMLRRVGGHFLITPDEPDAADATSRAALHAPLGEWAPLHPSLLHEWSADVQFRRYVAMLAERFARRR